MKSPILCLQGSVQLFPPLHPMDCLPTINHLSLVPQPEGPSCPAPLRHCSVLGLSACSFPWFLIPVLLPCPAATTAWLVLPSVPGHSSQLERMRNTGTTHQVQAKDLIKNTTHVYLLYKDWPISPIWKDWKPAWELAGGDRGAGGRVPCPEVQYITAGTNPARAATGDCRAEQSSCKGEQPWGQKEQNWAIQALQSAVAAFIAKPCTLNLHNVKTNALDDDSLP